MTKTANFANIPCYVLKSGSQPIFPTMEVDDSNTSCICVYGFSDKPIYDKLIKSVDQLVTPYPLVKGYLAKWIDDQDSGEPKRVCPGYVILDATDGAQPVLAAATIAAVLLAHQEEAKQVPVEIEFSFDPDTASYHSKKRDSKRGVAN